MEMLGKRSNYSLLSQFPDDDTHHHQPPYHHSNFPYESHSADGKKNKGKLDWDGDHRHQLGGGRIAGFAPSIGLQRQSSGSSFAESSISGDYGVPTNDPEVFGCFQDEMLQSGELAAARGREAAASSSTKSWAQQTEESYQLQLALALRLSSDATCADDPNFLDTLPDESNRSSLVSAEVLSHRFWVNGCLSYFDRIPDGFYLINGMDPYVWTICTDMQKNGRVPSIESLKAMHPGDNSLVEVVLIDNHTDYRLKELHSRVISLSQSCNSSNELVEQLGRLVCIHMGGAASPDESDLAPRWKECSEVLKDCLDSVVIPVGSISIGLCRHRALLFKVLADIIDLPCRIAKGCKFCRTADASSCVVRVGLDREYLVDLIEKPGCLYEPDSLLNGPSSILIPSPLRLPNFNPVERTEDSKSLAKKYLMDCQSLNLVFSDAPAGLSDNMQHQTDPSFEHLDGTHADMVNLMSVSGSADSSVSLPPKVAQSEEHGWQRVRPTHTSRDPGSQVVPSTEFSFDVEDLDIPWDNLIIKEKIGAGSFGTVHRADWNGSEVAVKILMEQDYHATCFKEFIREVALMKRLRHPNIVLFMGAVTRRPHLSIVTEYLARGSLYRLLHKSDPREIPDEFRRISMAYDVAKGMNYLHRRNPPIVHRDLKSPNLLVDNMYTVKVCDFWLSRLKANTYLSAKSAAGTPEWMAPEVLRDEHQTEKCDGYSFGVILWELMTLQKPWNNLNQAQVVAAVGFKHKRLPIPSSLDPDIAVLIEACWSKDPSKRPSFSSIMEYLQSLVAPPTPQPAHSAFSTLT
uniref:non-specific serine/threonine protein kinase n=1 Tax=Delphinium hybrid cultivar TaxID=151676 RepID=Q7X9G6_9MAGN|nr:constitutive triple response 1-like protein kinase [Delphinium hybrid cultivar]